MKGLPSLSVTGCSNIDVGKGPVGQDGSSLVEATFASLLRFSQCFWQGQWTKNTQNVSCDEKEQKVPRKKNIQEKSNLLYDVTKSPLHNIPHAEKLIEAEGNQLFDETAVGENCNDA
eukprot:5916292-Ditylum_brightwellii.AAC.1